MAFTNKQIYINLWQSLGVKNRQLIERYSNYIKLQLVREIRKELRGRNHQNSNIYDAYRTGLNVEKTKTGVKIILTNKLVNMFEGGFGPFDMKPGLLNSPKAKISKSGDRYIRVPIDNNIRVLSTRKYIKWIHPGFKGYNFIKRTLRELYRRIKESWLKV